MKIRIISDIHLDYNKDDPYEIKDKSYFTILAGDTSGDPKITIDWINKNVKNGLLISGNHIVYNDQHKTIQELRNQLAEAFPLDSNVTYLDNECGVLCKEIDGILFIGTTLYTNYKLKTRFNPSGNQEINMMNSARVMNDFRWGKTSKKEKLSPTDYVKWFNSAIININQILYDNERSPDPKPVVMITHHCPSIVCGGFESRYDDENNPSYYSDLNEFIEKHHSIKAWICGHTHEPRILEHTREDGKSKCIFILNPRGYAPMESLYWNENMFLDTKTWEISTLPLSEEQRKKDDEKFRMLRAFF